MFPGPHAEVFYNEAGEPLGWDYPSYEPPEPDPYEEAAADAAGEARFETAYEWAYDQTDGDLDVSDAFGDWACQRDQFKLEIEHAWANFKAKHP
jgi:hypothetical protein